MHTHRSTARHQPSAPLGAGPRPTTAAHRRVAWAVIPILGACAAAYAGECPAGGPPVLGAGAMSLTVPALVLNNTASTVAPMAGPSAVLAPAVTVVAPSLVLERTQHDAETVFDDPAPKGGEPGASPSRAAPGTTKQEPGGESAQQHGAFGQAGTDWLTIGGLYAYNFDEDHDLNVHVAWSRFIVDDVEFVLEAAAWYFAQKGQDTGGVSGVFLFRWHFLHAEDYRWSVFGDAGIGLLAGFDEVPDGGTGFNFLPRLGLGFTRAFDESVDGESRGPRWMVGVRWHHISNGRIEGDERNPARDSVAIYAGVTIPF